MRDNLRDNFREAKTGTKIASGQWGDNCLGTIRVHAKGVVLCERACFCLLSAF